LLAEMSAPESPAPLAAAIARATAHAPDQRYPSAAALAQDVARFLDGEAVSAHRESIGARIARLARRHRTALAIVSAYAAGRALIYWWLGR
jgi:serine/threonine-protein kinase